MTSEVFAKHPTERRERVKASDGLDNAQKARAIIVCKMKFIESIPQEKVADFCRRWQIREFALFGSVVRDDFNPESDVDVLVSFKPAADWGLFDQVQMRNELRALFNREVDLITRRALEQSQNQLLRQHILREAQVIFADNETAYAQG